MVKEPRKKKTEVVSSQIQELLRSQVNFSILPEKTLIYVAAREVSDTKNKSIRLHCKKCNAFSGYVYDATSDSIIINGIDFLELGHINYAAQATFNNTGNWVSHVPLPAEAIELALTPTQKRTLKEFTLRYPAPTFELHFVQMISCN